MAPMKRLLRVTIEDLKAAQRALAPVLSPSPLILNSWLSRELGCELYLKLESMLPIGSFKIRGATNKLSRLSAAEKKRGVIAASAGNHAQGVAWAARELGTSALIVMPLKASLMKVQNTRTLGAEVVLHGETYDEAFKEATRLAKKTKRVFVHPFEDREVIAGQGVLGLEIVEQLPNVDIVIGSLGGGGMMAGVAVAIREFCPRAKIFGCQAEGAQALLKSARKGKAVELPSVNTFADGIAVRRASPAMVKLLRGKIDSWFTADDDEIAQAVLSLLEKAKLMAEGAAALPLAVLEKIKPRIKGKKVVLILCGGNLDVHLLSRILDLGLTRAGRRLRVNVLISDRPGSLHRLTKLLADLGVNILQAIHDRNEPSVHLDETNVALTLETRGADHGAEVIRALKDHDHVLRVDRVV